MSRSDNLNFNSNENVNLDNQQDVNTYSMKKIAHQISSAGLCSRREAERLIDAGHVSLNGHIVRSCAIRVSNYDEIKVNGKKLETSPSRVILLHKPIQYLTSHKSQKGYKTIFDLIEYENFHLRGAEKVDSHMTFIGRLDYMSEGLVVLTNMNFLVKKFAGPEYTRVYEIYVDRISNKLRDELKRPVLDGIRLLPIKLKNVSKQSNCVKLTLELRQGLNREIRRLCQKCDIKVLKLKKIQHGPFKLGDLQSGRMRELHDFQESSNY